MFRRSLPKGFTILELVVVIVVLGVLAAIALPKYTSLVTQSRIVMLTGAKGSITSLATITNVLAGGTPTFQMSPSPKGTICMKNGYPDTTDGSGCSSVCTFLNLTGMTCTPGVNAATVELDPLVAKCHLQYSPTTTGPNFILTQSGC